jgi:hypothetical protein
MDNLEDIKIQILNLEKLILLKFNELDKKIELLNENNNKKIDEIKVECTKMGSHIDFIEETYNTLQTPLNFVKRSVERLIGSSSSKDLKRLPIKDKDTDV